MLHAPQVHAKLLHLMILRPYLDHPPCFQWCTIDVTIFPQRRTSIFCLAHSQDWADLPSVALGTIDLQHTLRVEWWRIQQLVVCQDHAGVFPFVPAQVGPNELNQALVADHEDPRGIEGCGEQTTIGGEHQRAILGRHRPQVRTHLSCLSTLCGIYHQNLACIVGRSEDSVSVGVICDSPPLRRVVHLDRWVAGTHHRFLLDWPQIFLLLLLLIRHAVLAILILRWGWGRLLVDRPHA
mmetsp:Transcript_102694/g.258739  ORF Transcript_102694/g.258739 Transcript_102694/m.258739 type:complete len:238 (-) Transcript_102694:960-1673(-)